MSLVEAGAFELDRPLTDYVTEPYLAGDEQGTIVVAVLGAVIVLIVLHFTGVVGPASH